MKKESFKAKIPVADHHVYSFVCNRYGNGSNVIKLSQRSLLGTLVELAADRIGYQHSLPRRKFEHQFYIELQFTDRLKNHYLSPDKLLLFSEFFDQHFKDVFLIEIEGFVSLGISDYKAVEHFMTKYGIVEDATIADTLRKRWRDRQKYLKRIYEKKLGDFYPEN
jgi:hypothetical protein